MYTLFTTPTAWDDAACLRHQPIQAIGMMRDADTPTCAIVVVQVDINLYCAMWAEIPRKGQTVCFVMPNTQCMPGLATLNFAAHPAFFFI